ncbi:MAG: hypothetical protein AAFX80_22555 [Cyanobacteria bacterium J06639_18]
MLVDCGDVAEARRFGVGGSAGDDSIGSAAIVIASDYDFTCYSTDVASSATSIYTNFRVSCSTKNY